MRMNNKFRYEDHNIISAKLNKICLFSSDNYMQFYQKSTHETHVF